MYLILLILLILLLFGAGGYSYRTGAPYGAPVGGLAFILLIVLIVLLATGRL
jgi:hypothetical protein